MKKIEPEPAGLYVGYARVSTPEQRLDLQLDALRAAGVLEDNLHIEEPGSATKKKRPALDLAIMDLRPGDTLVVWRLDRLARSMTELYKRLDQVKAQGASFKSLTEHFDFTTAIGQLVMGIVAIMAQFERQLTIERTKAGMAALKRRGKILGAPRLLDEAKVKRAMALLKAGEGGPETAKKLGVATSTIYAYFTVKRKGNKVIVTGKRKG